MTQAQLWKKLEAKGYAEEAISETVNACQREGYLDDALYATLYVEGARKALGNARLIAELVKRGIDREAAQRSVAAAPRDQYERLCTAYEKLLRTKPALSYPSAARSLERLGFPTSAIYRLLRERAQAALKDTSLASTTHADPAIDG